jgi:hypothetical protein
MTESFVNLQSTPSAIVSDGAVVVPIWAVTSISLSESYHFPAIGSSGAKALVATHDDTLNLSGVLVGSDRYTWKLALETLAEVGRRGGALAAATGGRVGGLILITAMTIRTDMQIQSLSFSASSAKRDTLDVSLSMVYMPLPGGLGKLLDAASLSISSLSDWAAKT